MVWGRCVLVVCLWVATCTPPLAKTKDCKSSYLKFQNATPPVKLEENVLIWLKPQNLIKKLRIQLDLETSEEEQLYCLGLVASMGVQWGDIEVTVKDIRTSNNVFKVSWPPVLFPKAWTALYLRLHYQHLLQLAFIPHDAMQQPRSFTFHPVILKPLAASIKLERGGITRLRLTLLTRNISLEYTVNCNQEYLATSFASEFGIPSSEAVWRTWVWILLGSVIILIVLLAVVLAALYNNVRKHFPNSFTLAKFQCDGTRDGVAPVLVSSSHGGKRSVADGSAVAAGSVNIPRVTVGIVSSRAPSPGHEVDENTLDYINRAFSHDE